MCVHVARGEMVDFLRTVACYRCGAKKDVDTEDHPLPPAKSDNE